MNNKKNRVNDSVFIFLINILAFSKTAFLKL